MQHSNLIVPIAVVTSDVMHMIAEPGSATTKIVLQYRKQRSIIVGQDVTTLNQLADRFNSPYIVLQKKKGHV